MQENKQGRIPQLLQWVLLATSIGCTCTNSFAQSFNSNSDGTDGDLIITTAGVTQFTQLPVHGGNVYNFKTITINAGSTLAISGQTFPWPIFLLAQSAVTIGGTIDISGQPGVEPAIITDRVPAAPGPGGFAGGLGAFGSNPAQPGSGPGGGLVGTGCYQSGGGQITVNQFAVPLVGGSGGGGSTGAGYGGGGGGGGAILIASSLSILVTGSINANGGSALANSPVSTINYAGGGAGGTIRLAAPTISGNGLLTAAPQGTATGGCPYSTGGANGVVRLEAFQNTFNGTLGGSLLYNATPVSTFVPTSAPPSITVTSIGGFPVSPSPTGSFTVPDVMVNSNGPLTIQMTAQNIPIGTVPTLFFFSENAMDMTVSGTGLIGTLASSTSTAPFTFSPGYSRGYVTATWSGTGPAAKPK